MGTYLRARKRLFFLGLAMAAAMSTAPSQASAAPWRCEASALSGSLLNGTIKLPAVQANPGAVGCVAQTSGGGVKLPLPLDSAAVLAQTSLSGATDNPAVQKVFSVGGLADVRVKGLPQLPLSLPEIPIPSELQTIQVQIPALSILVPAQTVTLDLSTALKALTSGRLLPDVDLLRVQGAVAYASAGCIDGVPRVAGASKVAGISVLGEELPVNQLVERTLTLLDTSNIDPSNLNPALVDLSPIKLPLGITLDSTLVKDLVLPAVRSAIDALPTISIPATLAQVKVTPGEQTTVGGLLTQRALRIQVGLLGQSLVDTVVGEAKAGIGDVSCVEPPALECTRKSLVLVDVFEKKGRVQLLGAADRKLAGKTADIVFEATGKVVARAKIAADGAFSTTAALPSKALRFGNDARYMARVGKEKSMNLKLARRMVVDEMVARDGKVVISGRVVGPMAGGKNRDILVTRRVSCTKMEKVGTFRPESDGTFSIAFTAPADVKTAVYRLSTQVRKGVNPKLFDTYTLPRAVNLLGQ